MVWSRDYGLVEGPLCISSYLYLRKASFELNEEFPRLILSQIMVLKGFKYLLDLHFVALNKEMKNKKEKGIMREIERMKAYITLLLILYCARMNQLFTFTNTRA